MTDIEMKIKEAAQKYYTDGSSDLSDEEFDVLVDQLRAENPDSGLLKVGWGYDTSIDSTPGEKVRHKYGTAGSLDKCRTWQELGWVLQHGPVDISLKLDGISMVLYYKHSKLVQALTRGDGTTGIDVTDKIKRIFPDTLNYHEDFNGAIRGEVLMPLANFEEFSKLHPEARNPRNSTAGLINAKEISEDLKYLKLVVYTIVGDESIADEWTAFGGKYSVNKIRQRLIRMVGNDNVVPFIDNVYLNESSVLKEMEKYRDLFSSFGYPSDGLVLTLQYLPAEMNLFPEVSYIAKAFKFASEEKESEIIEIEWNMTKTHYAMPKIHIKPIQLAGTTVEFCTAYNAQYIKENNLGPGSVVAVEKRGEIIPNVNRVVKSTEAQLITHCPDCGHELVWNGFHLQCTNNNCSNAIIQDTLIWMNNIAPRDGMGELLEQKMLNMLVDAGELKELTIEAIMESKLQLSNQTAQIKQNEFADMWKELHTCSVSPVKAILALNIPRIGGITAMKLAEHMDIVWAIYEEASKEYKTLPLALEVSLAKAIGNANAQSVENHMWKFERLYYLRGRIKESKKASATKGKIAITGKLSVKRADFEKELADAGYSTGDISKDTKFLITDDPNSNSSKNKKADQWGITKVTESEFRSKYIN